MDPVIELKETCEKIGRAFDEFKSENDKKSTAKDVAVEEKLKKLSQSIDDLTGTKADLEKRIKLADDQKTRIDTLEQEIKTERGNREEVERKLNMIRVEAAGSREAKEQVRQRHNLWLKSVIHAQMNGAVNLTAEQSKLMADVAAELKSLSITDDTTGGYLAPVEYVREIVKGVTELSEHRNFVRVRTTSSKSIQLPKRTAQFAALRTAEQATRAETDGLRYGMVEIDAPEMYALVDISQQNLEDSAFDLEAEIRMESEEQFAVKEGAEFVSGTGVGQLQGIVTATTAALIASTNSGAAASIADADGQANGIMSLYHAIKTQYARNGRWILNRVTLGSVRKLKDSQKQYIWQPGLANGIPNTIMGSPYSEVPDMPNEGAGLYPIGFGDWKRGYTLLDRIGMQLLRDPYTQATSGNIRFLMRRRVGGRVVLGEAMRMLKCSA